MAKLLGQDRRTVDVRLKIARAISSREQLAKLGILFAEMDTDKSGALDLIEFTQGIIKYDPMISPDDAEIIFSLVDEDKSGSLDLEEFKAMQKNSLELLEMATHLEHHEDEHLAGSDPEKELEKARLAIALNKGVRLQRSDSSFDPKMQGDIAMMAPAQLEIRKKLKESNRVQLMVRSWWNSCGLDESDAMNRELYMEISIALHRMVEPGVSLDIMRVTAADDWQEDLLVYGEVGGTLLFAGFYEAMFQLCDTWVDTTDESDYTSFIREMQVAHDDFRHQTAGLDDVQKEKLIHSMEGLDEARKEQLVAVLQNLSKEGKKALFGVVSELNQEAKEKLLDAMQELSEESQGKLVMALASISAESKVAMVEVMMGLSMEKREQLLNVAADFTSEAKEQLLTVMSGMNQKTQVAMLTVMAGLSAQAKEQLLDIMEDLGEQAKEVIMLAMQGMSEDVKATMLAVMSNLDAKAKVTAARVMGKMDAKQQKQFLGTMDKLAPDNQAALATLMEGMLASERVAFLRAAANMSEDEILQMMQAVALKTFKQCTYTYCACCTPGYVAPYAFKKSVGNFCKDCSHFRIMCGPLGPTPVYDLLSVITGDSRLLQMIGGGVDVGTNERARCVQTAASGAEHAGPATHAVENENGFSSSTVTKRDGSKVTTMTDVDGSVVQTILEHDQGDGTTTSVFVGVDGSTTTSVHKMEDADSGMWGFSNEKAEDGNKGHSQDREKSPSSNDKSAQSSMKAAQNARERKLENDAVYSRLSVLKRMGVIKTAKSSSDPATNSAYLLRALIASNAPPGEPFEKSLANVLAMLKSDNFMQALEEKQNRRRKRREQSNRKRAQPEQTGGLARAIRVPEEAPGYRDNYEDRRRAASIEEVNELADADKRQTKGNGKNGIDKTGTVTVENSPSLPKLAGRNQEAGSRNKKGASGPDRQAGAGRLYQTHEYPTKRSGHHRRPCGSGLGPPGDVGPPGDLGPPGSQSTTSLVRKLSDEASATQRNAKEAALYLRSRNGKHGDSFAISGRPRLARASTSALYLPHIPGASQGHSRRTAVRTRSGARR
jgi:hypothetical protein